jgi:hypothetical protein
MGTDIVNPISAHIIGHRYGITEIVKEFRKRVPKFCRGRPILTYVNNSYNRVAD